MTLGPPYTLELLLPFARAALKNCEVLRHPGFEAFRFVDGLSIELDKAGAIRIEKGSGQVQFSYGGNFPLDLARTYEEVFWYLFHNGFILPMWSSFPGSVTPSTRYWRTARGAEWANGADPMPEDVRGYIGHLDLIAPNLDPIIRQYISEGLGSFNRQHYFSAAVMLGAASEREIYLLGSSMVPALQNPKHSADLVGLLGSRKLHSLLTFIGERLREVSAPVRRASRGLFDGGETHLASMFESIRVQRNEAVHPETGTVGERSIRMAYESFPNAIVKAEAIREWCDKNPKTL